jgi:hypothetical protein
MKIGDFLKIETINKYENNIPVEFNKIKLNPAYIRSTEINENGISINFNPNKDTMQIFIIQKESKEQKISEAILNICYCYVTEEEFNRIYNILK